MIQNHDIEEEVIPALAGGQGRFVEVQAGEKRQWRLFQVGSLNSGSENCVKGKQSCELMDIPARHPVLIQM